MIRSSANGNSVRPPISAGPILKALIGLGLIWLLAVALTEGLTGAPGETVAIAPGDPVQRTIEWRSVDGSRGYVLQLRDQNARIIIERKLQTSRTVVELQPGRYSLRVAALNKFGKPASWSAWAQISVRRPARRQTTSDPPDANPDRAEVAAAMNAAGKKQSEHETDSGGGILRALVPGLSQYQRGQTWRGLGWMAAFGGLAATGYSYWQTGNSLSLQAEAATPLLLLSPLSGQPAAPLLLLQNRAGSRAAYDAAQSNQRTVGLIAGVLYLLQIADALWLAPDSAANELRTGTDEGLIGLRAGSFQIEADFRAPIREFRANDTRESIAEVNQGFHLRFSTRF